MIKDALTMQILIPAVKCEIPLIPYGSVMDIQSDLSTGLLSTGLYLYPGNTLNVSCDPGYFARQNLTTALCLSNGSWTELPSCKRTYVPTYLPTLVCVCVLPGYHYYSLFHNMTLLKKTLTLHSNKTLV